jgi:hypothetical protein
MVHSHYVAMGGFAVDVRDEKLQFLADRKYRHFTLTPKGFIWLAKCRLDLIPNLSKADIQDKSKASGLAKTLVCLQALWFCVQCIGRLSQKFTISLLELNTFAHAICTLLIYILWWDKPLDVEEPTLLQGEHLNEAGALILVSGLNSLGFARKVQSHKAYYATVTLDRLPNGLHDVPASSTGATRQYNELGEGPFEFPLRIQKSNVIRNYTLNPMTFSEGQVETHIDLNCAELACLHMAIEERQRQSDAHPGEVIPNRVLGIRTSDWPHTMKATFSTIVSFVVAGLCYGGIHLTAWSAPFPNAVQKLLWRLCSLNLVVSSPLALGLLVFLYFPRRPKTISLESLNHKYRKASGIWRIVDKGLGGLFILFLGFLALFYVFCRVFLIVECFLSLAHLPASVYQVPVWSQYFPHIG